MEIKPIGDHVIVEAILGKEDITHSGIILPDTLDKKSPEQGKVVAVGPGRMLENGSRATMSVKVGDTILFKKYSPDEIKLDNKDYLVLTEHEILAVLE